MWRGGEGGGEQKNAYFVSLMREICTDLRERAEKKMAVRRSEDWQPRM